MEILGSQIKLNNQIFSPKVADVGYGWSVIPPSLLLGLVMITAKLASVSLQLSLQLRCRSINRNVSLL